MVFPVATYGCESWTIKRAECRRTDAVELWCWRRLLRIPWTQRRSSQSILKETSPEDWCWSWNCNTLATWCKELTHLKRPWCWKRLKAGREGDHTGWDGWMASPTRCTWVWISSRNWWWTGKSAMLQSMGSQRVRHDWATGLNWTVFFSIQDVLSNPHTLSSLFYWQWKTPWKISYFWNYIALFSESDYNTCYM